MICSAFLAWLCVLALANACTVTIQVTEVAQFSTFEIAFNQFHDNQTAVCVTFANFESHKAYIVRLDHLPFLALSAKNDIQMHESKGRMQATFIISKLSNPLSFDRLHFTYIFGLEVREAARITLPWSNKSILVYRYLMQEYLPILGVIFVISLIAERYLFGDPKHFDLKHENIGNIDCKGD